MKLMTYKILQDGVRKTLTKHDDIQLKMMTCSHIEQDTFMLQDGTKEKRCKACGLWESDSI